MDKKVIANEEYLVVFKSHNQAMLVYKKLISKGISALYIQTPAAIATSCSKSIEFSGEFLEEVKEEIKIRKITIYGLYKKNTDNDGLKKYIKL